MLYWYLLLKFSSTLWKCFSRVQTENYSPALKGARTIKSKNKLDVFPLFNPTTSDITCHIITELSICSEVIPTNRTFQTKEDNADYVDDSGNVAFIIEKSCAKLYREKKAIKWSDNNLDKLFPFLHHSPSAYNYIALANDLFPAEKSNDKEKKIPLELIP